MAGHERRREFLTGIGALAGLVCFAGVGKKDTTGLRESTLCSLNSKT